MWTKPNCLFTALLYWANRWFQQNHHRTTTVKKHKNWNHHSLKTQKLEPPPQFESAKNRTITVQINVFTVRFKEHLSQFIRRKTAKIRTTITHFYLFIKKNRTAMVHSLYLLQIIYPTKSCFWILHQPLSQLTYRPTSKNKLTQATLIIMSIMSGQHPWILQKGKTHTPLLEIY